MPVVIDWIKDMQYLAQDDEGHGIIVESRKENAPAGFSPAKLLLVAAAGCMSNHLMEILVKKRLSVTKLRVTADGVRAADLQKRFTGITLTFEVHGNIPPETMEGVLLLVKEKYCSVLNSLDPQTPVNIESRIVA
ncbi:MAG: OsmC family protein [bacterium]|nr:OsmC family protein [bacterium]